MASLYDIIADGNLVTPSLSRLLFGDSKSRSAVLKQTLSLPKTMHEVCLFYSSLIQMNLLKTAFDRDSKVMDLCDDRLARTIGAIWGGGGTDLSEDMRVFSFLRDCISTDVLPDAFNEDSEVMIGRANTYYNTFTRNGMMMNVEDCKADFIGLIESMPMLSKIGYDEELQCLVSDAGYSMPLSPFFTMTSDGLYITTSVVRGEQNNSLRLKQVKYNSTDIRAVRRKEDLCVANDEYLHALCLAFGIDTYWYPQEEYLGTCMFVVRLSEVLSRAVLNNLRNDLGVLSQINGPLKGYFHGNADMVRTINIVGYPIDGNGHGNGNKQALQNLFMGLIITYGAFVTTHNLILENNVLDKIGDSDPNKATINRDRAKAIFEDIVKVIVESGYSSGDAEKEVALCYSRIDAHLAQLSRIVPPGSASYLVRKDHICAEQKAATVLELLGLQNSNLFADKESMLSVRDYFDMLINNSVALDEMVRSITRFLIAFYSRFGGEHGEIRDDSDPVECLETFRDFCVSTEKTLNDAGSNVIKEQIGRNICDIDILNNYIENFRRVDNWKGDGVRTMSRGYFFISYDHDDSDFVRSCVRQWRSMGFNIHFDGTQFEAGDNWSTRAIEEIRGDDCQGVILFLSKYSATSSPCSEEIKAAHSVASSRFDNDYRRVNQFLTVINMEEAPIGQWTADLLNTCEGEELVCVNTVRRYIHEDKIFISRYDTNMINTVAGVMDTRNTEKLSRTLDLDTMSEAEYAFASYLAFLKTGKFWRFTSDQSEEMRAVFDAGWSDTNHCVYPLTVSVKEARIKRDSVTILGYEVLNGKSDMSEGRVMISSDSIKTGDYYCIPDIRSCGECGEWMVNPLLVSFESFR